MIYFEYPAFFSSQVFNYYQPIKYKSIHFFTFSQRCSTSLYLSFSPFRPFALSLTADYRNNGLSNFRVLRRRKRIIRYLDVLQERGKTKYVVVISLCKISPTRNCRSLLICGEIVVSRATPLRALFGWREI